MGEGLLYQIIKSHLEIKKLSLGKVPNSVDPDQTGKQSDQGLVCFSICIFWRYYSMLVEQSTIFTVKLVGV